MIASTSVDVSSRRHELRDAARLALIPVGVAIVLGTLLVPRRAPPEGVPIPIADPAALAAVLASDHDVAERARREPLPGPVRALGSAIRDFHSLEVRDPDARALVQARRSVNQALMSALPLGSGPLLGLRAVELEGFIREAKRFTDTGDESAELQALAGAFVRSMRNEGWCDGHALAPPDAVLRVMFKQMWNAFVGLAGTDGSAAHAPLGQGALLSAFEPTLDEKRVLYGFYLSHAHPSKGVRDALAAARRGARNADACAALVEAERAATDSWRLEHIARLAAIDPAYPADYARGVAHFGRAEYGASADSFRKWLSGHPDGPLALRAQNFLRAAADAARPE